MGDFNAHLDSLDGAMDAIGQELLEMADQFNLVKGNFQPKCEGFTMWSSENRKSCIDYAVTSPGLYDSLTRMVIDEEGDHRVGSDHNRMLIEFGGKMENERGGNECKWFLTERYTDQIAERLEVTPWAE
ncbi:hypothetical protein ISCGN_017084 [Ixodes scapularis]